MPKQRITKEMIVDAAFAIARSDGMERVMVQTIANRIGCSVQPIYSYCKNMDGLRGEVVERVRRFIVGYLAAHADPSDPFGSTGRAYVRLAGEEPHLFRIFILHKRKGISSLDELYRRETDAHMAKTIADRLQIGLSEAKELHLHMLIYTIGVGTIFSVTTPGIPVEEIDRQQQKAYEAFVRGLSKEKTDER